MTARSSAIVLAALTLRMNCFTEVWPLMVSFQCSSAMSAGIRSWSLGPADAIESLARVYLGTAVSSRESGES